MRANRMMIRSVVAALALGCVVVTSGCGRITRDVRLVPDAAASLEQLWQQPDDIARRNLYYGPGGSDLMPRQTTFTFVARDTGGWSPGFDVATAAVSSGA
jgi:hypothetical protein